VIPEKREIETLWTVWEAASFLNKSRRWVFSKLKLRPDQKGSLPHVRVGGGARFEPGVIRDWVRAGCPPAARFCIASTEDPKNGK
jgi:hypothetical protein